MPTTVTHLIIGAAVCSRFTPHSEKKNVFTAVVLAGIVVAVWPDIDVATRWLGVERGTLFAHRGVTHSFFAAAIVSGLAAYVLASVYRLKDGRLLLFLCLFLAGLSHGVLDAATDGGSGVALFAPFEDARHFLSWRPIKVSPIGLYSFLSERGARVIMNEAIYIWLPLFGLLAASVLFKRAFDYFKKNSGADR